MDLALNDLQGLIGSTYQPTNQPKKQNIISSYSLINPVYKTGEIRV